MMEIANVQTRGQEDKDVAGHLELDSRADTNCLGTTCSDITYSDKVCEVPSRVFRDNEECARCASGNCI